MPPYGALSADDQKTRPWGDPYHPAAPLRYSGSENGPNKPLEMAFGRRVHPVWAMAAQSKLPILAWNSMWQAAC